MGVAVGVGVFVETAAEKVLNVDMVGHTQWVLASVSCISSLMWYTVEVPKPVKVAEFLSEATVHVTSGSPAADRSFKLRLL